jgi:nucleoside-diphosphate-sugar epimerase
MRVIVTGCAGFIGFHLTRRLLNEGYQVIGLDNFSTGRVEHVKLLKELSSQFRFEPVDIEKADQVKDLFWATAKLGTIDCVFHQAALGSVPRSITEPEKTTASNILGFQNVIHAAQLTKAERFVYASSSSVYGAKTNSTSPYALSKSYNEMLAKLYSDLYGMETVGLRYFNVFGPKQLSTGSYAAVIPRFIRLISENKEIEIHGDGNQARDFTYVDNVVEANLKAMLAAVNGHYVMDIGCAQTVTVNDLATCIAKLMQKELQIRYSKKDRPGNALYSCANLDEARRVIGYEPEVGFHEGLKRTILDHARTFAN